MYTPITIIGTGAAGLILLHMFQEANVIPDDITCIDPNFIGGALQTHWPTVISNTKWCKLQESMKLLHPNWKDTTQNSPDSTTPLSEIIHSLRNPVRQYLNQCQLYAAHVTSISQDTHTNLWTISTDQGISHTTHILFICTGSKEKTLSLPIPAIPLRNALSFHDLQTIVKPSDKIVVFGTQHSGCLVIGNLHKIGCHVMSIFKGKTPFLFARDGEYDGIKEDAATIADSILEGKFTKVEQISFSDIQALSSAIRKADWVIYAIGFSPSHDFSLGSYDSVTGKFPMKKNAWGFGIAFPSSAPDSIHYDVGIVSFTAHILKQRSEILERYTCIKLQDTN